MFHVHVVADSKVSSVVPAPPATAARLPVADACSASPEPLSFSLGALNVDVFCGQVRLFRENGSPPGQTVGLSKVVSVLAIPTHVSFPQFLSFLGPFMEVIDHMRVLRDQDTGAGRYLALIHFTRQDMADAFVRGYNGKRFSSLDSHSAVVVHVASVKMTSHQRAGRTVAPSALDALNDSQVDFLRRLELLPSDPLLLAAVSLDPSEADGDPTSVAAASLPATSVGSSTHSPANSAVDNPPSPLMGAVAQLTELPSCPVCLERLVRSSDARDSNHPS